MRKHQGLPTCSPQTITKNLKSTSFISSKQGGMSIFSLTQGNQIGPWKVTCVIYGGKEKCVE